MQKRVHISYLIQKNKVLFMQFIMHSTDEYKIQKQYTSIFRIRHKNALRL